MNINEEIIKLKTSFEDTEKGLAGFRQEFKDVKKDLSDVKSAQLEFLSNFRENLKIIEESNKKLSDSIYDFNLLKNKLQNQIVEKFEEELRKELKINLDKIKKDNEEYKDLKFNLDVVLNKSKNVALEIDKFLEISKNIKAKDFELSEYNNNLKNADKEKLDLLMRIDNLEKLISKMRRNNR